MTQNTNKFYTLISYLESHQGWHSRCGDYQEGTNSELNVETFTDHQSIGESMGKTQFTNNEFQFNILINGIDADSFSELLDNNTQYDYEKEADNIREIAANKVKELTAIKAEKDAAEALIKKQAQELRERQERENIERVEREQLAILMKKYR